MVIFEILIAIIMLTAGYYAACTYLNKAKETATTEKVLAINKNRIIYIIAAAGTYIVLILLLNLLYCTPVIQQIKLYILIGIMLPAAAVDFKTNIIPNKFMLSALIIRCLFYLVEFIIIPDEVAMILKESIIGSIIIAVFFLLISLIFKNSIGMGDIKLFAIMGLYQGLWGVLNSVFYSLIVSFVVSVTLLITKKKNRKDTIAFGPSILIGTILGIALSGM